MLTKKTMSAMPKIVKRVNGKDASDRGAFSTDEQIDFMVGADSKKPAHDRALMRCHG